MEALLQSLATKYGMEKAVQLLGLDQQTQNPKYAISMGGTTLDVGNMAKRGLLNRGVNAITSGAGAGILPFAGIAGLAMLGNKYRKQITGYNTQQAYEDARDQRKADNRLGYITDRMTSGKDYGNYEEALLDSGAGAVKIDGTIYSGPDYQGGNNNNGGGGGNFASQNTGSNENFSNTTGKGRTGYGRGGIARL